jgi:hypothetical protein
MQPQQSNATNKITAHLMVTLGKLKTLIPAQSGFLF